jgi:hypothetical protein
MLSFRILKPCRWHGWKDLVLDRGLAITEQRKSFQRVGERQLVCLTAQSGQPVWRRDNLHASSTHTTT